MLHAHRLVYPLSQHASPQLWEDEQPYIANLILNARTFDRRMEQCYFPDREALARESARIRETYYRSKLLFADIAMWEDGLPEYRHLMIEVQEIYEAYMGSGVM
jgi:hypothetical protein